MWVLDEVHSFHQSIFDFFLLQYFDFSIFHKQNCLNKNVVSLRLSAVNVMSKYCEILGLDYVTQHLGSTKGSLYLSVKS